ncbi:MAG TPA: signal peptidase I [Polyangia bacterium]|nr:signal peptidase I [Polyangia bacterium]
MPAVAAVLMLRFLIPSRLEGAEGGTTGLWAWLGYHQPLFLGVAFFVALSEAGRYWMSRLRTATGSPALAASGGVTGRGIRRLFAALAVVVVVAFVLRGTVAATFRVAGPSMLPTLEIGDRVLVDRLAYGLNIPYTKVHLGRRTPARGDLVVFRANGLTGADGPQSVVKRVIGLPGDDVSYENGVLAINGWHVPACDAGPYVHVSGHLTVRGRLTVEYLGDDAFLTVRKPIEHSFPNYTVAPGEVFVVGDDRGLSSDSRLWNEGRGAGVPSDSLEGRVSRVLLGARPDGRLDFGRLLTRPFGLTVRLPGFDIGKVDERISNCLARRPTDTSPPPPAALSIPR